MIQTCLVLDLRDKEDSLRMRQETSLASGRFTCQDCGTLVLLVHHFDYCFLAPLCLFPLVMVRTPVYLTEGK